MAPTINRDSTAIIMSGSILNQGDKNWYSYQIHLLNAQFLDQILALQSLVSESIDDNDLFIPARADVLAKDLGEEGLTVGLIVEKKLVGYFSLHYLSQSSLNNCCNIDIAQDLRLPEEEINKVVRFRFVAIHPEYRGNSMCKKMSQAIFQAAQKLNRPYRYLCTMASPKNYPSLDHQFANQMMAVKLKKNHADKYRLLLFQDLEQPLKVRSEPVVAVAGHDISGLTKILECGYIGFALQKNSSWSEILFGLPQLTLAQPTVENICNSPPSLGHDEKVPRQ